MTTFGLQDLADAVAEFAPDVMAATSAPGVVVAVGDRSGEVKEMAFGFADVAAQAKMTPGHVMQGGSLSKLYVATAIMQLVEECGVDLDAPIETYIKGFMVRNSLDGQPVTARHLLTHTSGLATDSFDVSLSAVPPVSEYLAQAFSANEAREYAMRGSRWTLPTGQAFQYSSFGLATVAELIAAVAGVAFDEYILARVIRPAGMTAAAFPRGEEWRELGARRATGYMRFGDWLIPTPELQSATYTATGLRSTAGDHTRLLVALMNGGHGQSGRLLTEASVRSMTTPAVKARIEGTASDLWYGVSTQLAGMGTALFYFGHGGSYPLGWWSESRAYPELGFAITVQTNSWDMVRYYSPHERIPTGIIVDYAAACMAGGRAQRRPGFRQARSYAMGVISAERIYGLFGIEPSQEVPGVTALVDAAISLDGLSWAGVGERRAFEAGFGAMREHATNADTMRAFLASDDCEVAPSDIGLFALNWGASRATANLLIQAWAERR
jgi:CubicO group peptidase (beta-lactamase class C family)